MLGFQKTPSKSVFLRIYKGMYVHNMNIPLFGQGLNFSYLLFLLGNIIMSPGCDVKHVMYGAECEGKVK